ncbi:hypothetical protein [Sedimentitalea nanhaiensis]|uniref:Uncharacterized protein n=1 Tax=Sedimentitalea nanhaiensis TaxID=999627 RepID=A0A1I7CSS9_9RHOB|nr:hypothetical protein [Sedimentitalea nanhaiensis]SFU02458.1 hypothetical protein SAMN05216236_11953 [Sedimentitalea nanhaiensis]
MIVAFVILGALGGLIAGTTTLYTGGSVLESMLAYTGMGTTTALLSCMTFAITGRNRPQRQSI